MEKVHQSGKFFYCHAVFKNKENTEQSALSETVVTKYFFMLSIK